MRPSPHPPASRGVQRLGGLLAVVFCATTVPAEAQTTWDPAEWESITVTRFARHVIPGVRWVGVLTEQGVLFYDRLREQWAVTVTPADGLPEGRATALWRQENGLFRYATAAEQVTIEPGTGRVRTAFPASPPEAFSVPLPDNLYTDPSWQYLPDGRLAGPLGVDAVITDSRTDGEGNLWITTWGLGTGRAEENSRRLQMKPQGLWNADVRALLIDGDTLLAAGYALSPAVGGLTEWRMRTDEWKHTLAFDEPGLLSDRVSAMVLADRDLWLATDAGLAHRDARGRWTQRGPRGLPDPRITALAAGAGGIWVGTMRGAAVAAGDSITLLPLLGPNRITDLASTPGAIWWATEGGAWVWRGTWPEGRFDLIEHPTGALNGRIDAVCARGDTVWWGTTRGIVAGRPEAGEWLTVPASGPFLPGEITDLAVDDYNLWVTTFRGVRRLIRATGIWHYYTERDGLVDERVWRVVPRDGEAWFATAGGLTRFDWRQRRERP